MSAKCITFGAGGQNYIDAGQRLMRQAHSLNIFNSLQLYTDLVLKTDEEFWNKHGDFITTHTRGYGYWLWKPYIIKKAMETMSDGDILLYLDGGCEIDTRQKQQMIDLFKYVKQDYIIASTTPHMEKDWVKMDLSLHLGMNNPIYLNTPQRQATTIMFLINSQTRQFVDEWYSIMCNYHFIDDSPSIAINSPRFQEHRHDQSVFSLLTKKYNIFSKRFTMAGAVQLLRNRTGNSYLGNGYPAMTILNNRQLPYYNKRFSLI
jgi:hypothetical protein